VTADDARLLAARVAELEDAIERHRDRRVETAPVGGLHDEDIKLWAMLEDDE
jgi:hypothetical protein